MLIPIDESATRAELREVLEALRAMAGAGVPGADSELRDARALYEARYGRDIDDDARAQRDAKRDADRKAKRSAKRAQREADRAERAELRRVRGALTARDAIGPADILGDGVIWRDRRALVDVDDKARARSAGKGNAPDARILWRDRTYGLTMLRADAAPISADDRKYTCIGCAGRGYAGIVRGVDKRGRAAEAVIPCAQCAGSGIMRGPGEAVTGGGGRIVADGAIDIGRARVAAHSGPARVHNARRWLASMRGGGGIQRRGDEAVDKAAAMEARARRRLRAMLGDSAPRGRAAGSRRDTRLLKPGGAARSSSWDRTRQAARDAKRGRKREARQRDNEAYTGGRSAAALRMAAIRAMRRYGVEA